MFLAIHGIRHLLCFKCWQIQIIDFAVFARMKVLIQRSLRCKYGRKSLIGGLQCCVGTVKRRRRT